MDIYLLSVILRRYGRKQTKNLSSCALGRTHLPCFYSVCHTSLQWGNPLASRVVLYCRFLSDPVLFAAQLPREVRQSTHYTEGCICIFVYMYLLCNGHFIHALYLWVSYHSQNIHVHSINQLIFAMGKALCVLCIGSECFNII